MRLHLRGRRGSGISGFSHLFGVEQMLKVLAALGGVTVALVVTASVPRSSPVVTSEAHPGMVLVAAGPFAMGSTEEEVNEAFHTYGGSIDLYRPEVPRRIVSLPAFWID